MGSKDAHRASRKVEERRRIDEGITYHRGNLDSTRNIPLAEGYGSGHGKRDGQLNKSGLTEHKLGSIRKHKDVR